MDQANSIGVLNRLLGVHNRSFPTYLTSARPWIHGGEEKAAEALQHIAADQKEMVNRIASLILSNDEAVDLGEYPMEFTDTHDLSLDYLLHELVRYQQQDIATIESCVEQLNHVPMARALAEESLGAAKGHLESLKELLEETNHAQT